MQGCRTAAIESAISAPVARSREAAVEADSGTGAFASEVRLSTNLGAASRRGLACEQETDLPALASGRPQGAKETAKTATVGQQRSGLHPASRERKDHVWALDFVHDRTIDGRPLKWLAVIDEFTRECLALDVARSIKSGDVIDTLVELFQVRGVPTHVRFDNGPEFIALAVQQWLERSSVRPLYIEPGAPWENGYVESFNGKLGDELLDREVFYTVQEARAMGTSWRLEYDNRRPHSSLGYMTPAAFAASCSKPCCAALRKTTSSQYHQPTLTLAGP